MNKKHHPQSREERLRLKLEHEQKQKKPSHAKRRLKESLQFQETENDLKNYRNGNFGG